MATEKVRDARTIQLVAGLPTGEVRHPTHGPRLAWSMPLLVLVGFAESAPRTDGSVTESPPGTSGAVLPPFSGRVKPPPPVVLSVPQSTGLRNGTP